MAKQQAANLEMITKQQAANLDKLAEQQALDRSDRKESERKAREELKERKAIDIKLGSLPKVTDTEDLELFLEGFEQNMVQCCLGKNEWVFHMTNTLTAKYLDIIRDAVTTGEGYDKVKPTLLRAAGYSERQAGVKIFAFNYIA